MRFPFLVVALAAVMPGRLAAAETVFELDPGRSVVEFTLHDPLHTVHGTFKVKRGNIHLDSEVNKASGQIIVDVTTGDSGSSARDHRMHKDILESQKYPEAVFTPDRMNGRLAPEGQSEIDVHGIFRMHGADHELTLHFQVQAQSDNYTATGRFTIPYVKWGMKNPSNFLLKVDDKVEMGVRVVAAR